MSELIERLSRCFNSEEVRYALIQLDDRHLPVPTTASWFFTYHGQKFEYTRHGGYLRFSAEV